MRIDSELKLDFADVLIRPKVSDSDLPSRANVDITRTFTFKWSKRHYQGIPLIAANMDTVATFHMADALTQLQCVTALHKHYSVDQLLAYFDRPRPNVWYSMGISDADASKYYQVRNSIVSKIDTESLPHSNYISHVCIDVANGYSTRFIDFIKKFREQNPCTTIMAGNVVTADITEQLILAGVDVVKVGIGPGCLTADARILMSNGTYKNIVDVKTGDEIITMKGTPAKVKRSFTTGLRRVVKIRNAHFHSPLYLTADHKCYVGDLSSVSTSTLQSRGYKTVLASPTRRGESKLKWKPAGRLERTVALMPSEIQFTCPTDFSINLQSHFKHSYFEVGYNKHVTSSYDVGYFFGTFLGDGHALLDDNFSGRVQWYFHKSETSIVNKLVSIIEKVTGKAPIIRDSKLNQCVIVTLNSKQWASVFCQFGKKELKHLPEMFMCTNNSYLRGLYDGLIDSDGHVNDNTERLTNTSKQIIELFNFISLVLFKGCVNVNKPQMQSSWLVTAINESHTAFVSETLKKRLVGNFQTIKLLDIQEESKIEVPVYDLEIDDETHSFIANNMIVHNSACTTRKMTGVGYPQLSAVIECADAAHGVGGLICSDGGCVEPGDIAKAFGAGADFVMLGGMLAGHVEGGGNLTGPVRVLHHEYNKELLGMPMNYNLLVSFVPNSSTKRIEYVMSLSELMSLGNFMYRDLNSDANRQLMIKFPLLFDTLDTKVEFYGMSSKAAQAKHHGGVAEYRASEGKRVLLPYKGSVSNTIKEILGGIRSTCTYVGARSLKELSKRTTFMRVTNTRNRIFDHLDTKD